MASGLGLLAVGGLAITGVANASEQVSAAPAEGVVIEVVTANGSGCPSTKATVTPSGQTEFTVTFSGYSATTAGAPAPNFRKNCQFNIRVNRPEGFTYAVGRAEYSGFADLANGATAAQLAHYYFQGSSATRTFTRSFAGPLRDNWKATDVVDAAAQQFAPCGEERNLNINTELRVNAGSSGPGATSFVALDPKITYHLAWRHC